MRWPWARQRAENGHAAKAAAAGATEALRRAEGTTPRVDRAARTADQLARRTDRFVRDFERSLHPRGSE